MITYKELGAVIEIAARSPMTTAERIWLDGLSERILAEQQKRMEQAASGTDNVLHTAPIQSGEPAKNGVQT